MTPERKGLPAAAVTPVAIVNIEGARLKVVEVSLHGVGPYAVGKLEVFAENSVVEPVSTLGPLVVEDALAIVGR